MFHYHVSLPNLYGFLYVNVTAECADKADRDNDKTSTAHTVWSHIPLKHIVMQHYHHWLLNTERSREACPVGLVHASKQASIITAE